MRILHTSDWHLGKHLETKSRLDEQKRFLEELNEICDEKDVDLVLVCGDIYDTSNPPADAEKLFYANIRKLCKNGSRPVIIIAGNHDSSERLIAANPLANEMGIIILGTPEHVALEIGNEKISIACMPYPSEKRLNEIISDKWDEHGIQLEYSKKIGEYFKQLSKGFKDDTINIAAGHFYITGGDQSESERDITLGGIYAVNAADLPKNAQYLAMGHLHRPQKTYGGYYSGSPLQYSKSEIGYAKCVILVDVEAGVEAKTEKILLKNYKPIEIVTAGSASEAVEIIKTLEDKECYIYLELHISSFLSQSELKEIRSLKDDIVDISVLTPEIDGDPAEYVSEKTAVQEFADFYRTERGIDPSSEILSFFTMLAEEEEGVGQD